MYRNDFGVNEHGSLGRIIYQWKSVFNTQTNGIREHLCSKVERVNHSAYSSDTTDKTRNFSFSSSTVWGSVLYLLSFRSPHKKITAVVYR